MSLQGNLQKLKKAIDRNKPVYITYGNYEHVNGKVSEIGKLFVHIKTDDQDKPVVLEIEKIINISLFRKGY